jgi:hypothetical protein
MPAAALRVGPRHHVELAQVAQGAGGSPASRDGRMARRCLAVVNRGKGRGGRRTREVEGNNFVPRTRPRLSGERRYDGATRTTPSPARASRTLATTQTWLRLAGTELGGQLLRPCVCPLLQGNPDVRADGPRASAQADFCSQDRIGNCGVRDPASRQLQPLVVARYSTMAGISDVATGAL